MTTLARRQLNFLYGLRWLVLPPVVAVTMFALIAGAVVVAPREAVEGEVQRIFYIHLPSALTMYAAFFVVFCASIMVLWKRDLRYDAIARAAAGVGVLFTIFTLATGAIWGRPIWGVFWTWDARLTSTLILLLLYGGYLLARSLSDPGDEQAARYGAVFAILAFADIPVINMSVRWWRTLHPQPMVFRPGEGPNMPGEMVIVLLVGIVAVFALMTWLIILRSEAELLAQRVDGLRARLDQQRGW